VVSCDKAGGAAHKHYIPASPNGTTRYAEGIASPKEKPTPGTETSKYREEEKEKSIPSVAASESGRAQTDRVFPGGVVGPLTWELPNHLLTERHGKAVHRG
jgi:hypothetical protein